MNIIQKKPVLLLVDGHKSHMSLQLSEYCHVNGIILYALPLNTTHILQPAAVGLFKSLKENWRQHVRRWQNKPEKINNVLTKTTFVPLLDEVLKQTDESIMRNAFRKCGLFPFDPSTVDFSKCIQNQLENNSKKVSEEIPIEQLNTKDFKSARKVIKKIDQKLIDYGINPTVIINEINYYEEEAKVTTPVIIENREYDYVEEIASPEPLALETGLEGDSIISLDVFNQ